MEKFSECEKKYMDLLQRKFDIQVRNSTYNHKKEFTEDSYISLNWRLNRDRNQHPENYKGIYKIAVYEPSDSIKIIMEKEKQMKQDLLNTMKEIDDIRKECFTYKNILV